MTADDLFKGNIKWAQGLAAHNAYRRGQPSDLAPQIRNAALVGLWQATRAYEPARGVKFRSFAYSRVLGAVRDELRSFAWWPSHGRNWRRMCVCGPPPKVHRVGLRGEASGEHGRGISLEEMPDDRAERPEDDAIRGEEGADCRRVLELFPAGAVRSVAEMYYVRGLPMSAIAIKLNLSDSRISQILAAGIAEVRQRLGIRLDVASEPGAGRVESVPSDTSLCE